MTLLFSAGRNGLLAATCVAALAFAVPASAPAFAHDGIDHSKPAEIRADSHAPIGVMGDHMHKEGEIMFSYRYKRMDMSDVRDGTDDLSNAEVLATPNRFFGNPGQPPRLRIIPTEMVMDMHMLGAMYAPNDYLTLMVMGMYMKKEMDHITFNPAGTTQIGGFTTVTEGFGDTRISGLVRILDQNNSKVHLNIGVSLPTGSIKEEDTILTPLGTTANVRLPYPMQLGSGTVDILPGVTYSDRTGDISWGAQAMATLRSGRNSEDYKLGNIAEATTWAAYQFAPWISTSVRLKAESIGKVSGQDARIMGPVQTADPSNIGGRFLEAGLGVNLVGQDGFIRGHRLAIEASMPVVQDLNGPQMKRDWTLTAGWQYAF
ncbi:alpha-amylase [Candidatus Phaeomarinobacter ectocarpi]|nr:alpha-amylase [Candidatus Phaeomarinobacter ectocarpi]